MEIRDKEVQDDWVGLVGGVQQLGQISRGEAMLSVCGAEGVPSLPDLFALCMGSMCVKLLRRIRTSDCVHPT